jgi:GntR family transcriptional repressor for pyruvate dehydrogenase complex
MSLEPIKRHGLPADITEKILNMIKNGHYAAGEKLPNERQLATQLQVSRPSLREAMRSLAFMNIVEIRQGDGTYVSSLEPELLVEPLDFILAVGGVTNHQLLQARFVVEPPCAFIAAHTISRAQIDLLKTIAEEARHITGDLAHHADLDIRLHTIIAEATENPLLQRFLSSIVQLDKAARVNGLRNLPPDLRRERTQRAYLDHLDIIAMLEAHDPAQARDAMTEHLRNVEVSFRAAGILDLA